MAQLVKKIRTEQGDLQIDYNALANLPDVVTKAYGNATYVTQESGDETYVTYEYGDNIYLTKNDAEEAYAPRGMVTETVSYGADDNEDEIIMNLFVNTRNNTQRAVYAVNNGSPWFWIIAKTSDDYGCIIAYKYGYWGIPFVKYKSIWEGTVSSWSVTNPEMEPGVEYRTIEHWRGYPVYTKLIDFGALPNNIKKSVSYTDVSVRSAIRCSATTSAGDTIPLKNGTQELAIYASNKNIHITSNYDASGMTGYAQVWYVKN